MTTALTALVLALAICLPAAATAAPPKIYDQARALPTRSGDHVKIVVFTNRITSVKVSADGNPRIKAKLFGVGCGKRKCEKWRLYADRTGNECYEITIVGRRGKRVARKDHTVCEPFRGGEI